MSAEEALNHDWIREIGEKLISELSDDKADNADKKEAA